VTPPARRAFGALRHPGFRAFFACSALAMCADVIEHVISYWVIYQKFHSAALGGFAVVSHWVPYLTLSVYSGMLADRFDPRRLIQLGMGLFMLVSVGWGLLFLSGGAEMWQAMVLLVVHGLAGVLWNPSSQLLLYDIVGPVELQSAVRLGATARYLGMLAGPGLGALLLHALGPVDAIFVNVLIYLPMVMWLVRAPYGPRFRATPAPRAIAGLREAFATLGIIRRNPVLLSMTLLAGGASFCIGSAYQAQMPGFAHDLGHGDPGVAYGMLLGADAFGALAAGFLLEARGLLAPDPRSACLLALVWCLALGGFALAHSYPLVLLLLATAGFVELSFSSMAQALVQVNAPAEARGRVIGVFMMAALGLRTFSGILVGVLGSIIGIHASLALAAGTFLVVPGILLLRLRPLLAPLRTG
jgi:MFS family permease